MMTHVRGLNLWHATEGRGIPVVIPSLAGSTFYERSFFLGARNELQTIHVELRGNRSEVGRVEGLTIDQLSDSLRDFLDTIRLGKIVLLGHSGHGFLAMDFAARYPDRVSHLILAGAAPTFGIEFEAEGARYWEMLASPERKAIDAENQQRLATERGKLSAQDAITRTYVLGAPRLFFDPRFDCTSLWEGAHPSAEIWDRFWGSGGEWKRFEAAKTLPAIKCPTLIIAGIADFVVPPTLWYRTKDLIPDHEYALLDRSGHNPQCEEAARFDRTVMDWLKRH
ncbi:MAG TPA: alpha/beta hydrolase [Candidatus Binataceae bacterium]|nr:alpha/beta hydrolase [Candidatus Binataceae bacterium]